MRFKYKTDKGFEAHQYLGGKDRNYLEYISDPSLATKVCPHCGDLLLGHAQFKEEHSIFSTGRRVCVGDWIVVSKEFPGKYYVIHDNIMQRYYEPIED
jgi:hypothetical protein